MLTKKEICKSIQAIGRTSEKLRDMIQVVAVSLIGHAFDHGDVTQANDLLAACGKQVDRQALVQYLEDFGPFRFQSKEGTFKLNKKFRDENVFDEDHLNHVDTPKWFDYGRAPNQLNSKFDVEARTLSLLKQLDKAKEDGKTVMNEEFAVFLKKAITQYNGLKSTALRIGFHGVDADAKFQLSAEQIQTLETARLAREEAAATH